MEDKEFIDAVRNWSISQFSFTSSFYNFIV